MPKRTTDAEAALQKLGQRVRAGIAAQHPAPNLETVRDAVREQWEQEQESKGMTSIQKPLPDKTKDREQAEPDTDR